MAQAPAFSLHDHNNKLHTLSSFKGKVVVLYFYPKADTPGCTAWFDGCNRCSKGPGDSAMCTLMACMGEPVPGYCTSYDTVEPSVATDPPSSGDGAPPIPTAPPGENPDSEPRGFLARMWFIVTSWFLSLF